MARKSEGSPGDFHTIGSTAGLFVLLLGAGVGFAQLPTATILGVVKDSSGAVVPDVSLTAHHTETGQSRSAQSAADGSFRFSALAVGNYEIRVEHPGFQSIVRSGLTLTVSQEAVLNFTLQVGAIEQTVAVTAEAPLVNTTSGTLGGLVDEQRVAELPLNGRNYVDLTLLQTGVSADNAGGGAGGTGPMLAGTWFSSNGSPVRSNNFLLDGAAMDSSNGTSSAAITNTTLGVEGVREYRVVTNSFSAEYGMRMGSQMTIVSKSGTNNFHGTLFEYLRNSALDARNFFDRQTIAFTRRIPAFTRNQFGGSFGGPIKKDRTFFHVVFEELRERLGRTLVSSSIPASSKADGGLVPQIAPIIKPFLRFFPDPNLPANQYTFPFSQPTNEHYGQIRGDQTFSGRDSLFARYTVDDASLLLPTTFPQFSDSRVSRNQFSTLSEIHIFSPTLLNTSRFSFSRTNLIGEPLFSSEVAASQFSFMLGLPMGSFAIGGVSTIGAGNTSPSAGSQNVFAYSDDLFYTRGRHSLKMGTLINRYQQYVLSTSSWRGQVRFADIRSFLLGTPSDYNATTPGSILDRTYFYTTLGFYLQDDWRVRSNWTLNLGLRYEFNKELNEARGHGSAVRDVVHDSRATLGRPYINPALKNFSPRFGFAWDVKGDGKTAVRGGFGLLYDIVDLGPALKFTTSTPPFSSQSAFNNSAANPTVLTLPLNFPTVTVGRTLRALDYHLQQPHMLQFNFAVERQLPHSMALAVAYGGSRGINLAQKMDGNPTFPVTLPNGRRFWTGTEPRNNPNFDAIEFVTASGDSFYNSLQIGLAKRMSRGLQFQSSYTWGKVIDDTQGQLVGDSSIYPPDPTNLRLDRAPAGFDITQNWRFNAIYRLPDSAAVGKGLGVLLKGWTMSGILSMQTGYPINPQLQNNRSRSKNNVGTLGATTDRPDLVAGRGNNNIVSGTTAGCLGVAPGQKLGTPDLYFDPCAFTVPAAGFMGTAGRNILRGPGFANLDFSLVKDTALKALGESGSLEFRAEFFNLFNRANLAPPNAVVFAGSADVQAPLANAAKITQTRGTSRQIQFAMKLIF